MITWKVKNSKRQAQTGLVTMITMQLVAQQNDVVAEQELDIVLRPKDPSESDFVPFDQLTEDQFIDWAKQSLKPEGVASTEVELNAKLQEKLNPPILDGLPWD